MQRCQHQSSSRQLACRANSAACAAAKNAALKNDPRDHVLAWLQATDAGTMPFPEDSSDDDSADEAPPRLRETFQVTASPAERHV